MADNSITLVGNLTRDPELRFTQSGKPTVTLGLAVSRRYQVNGEWQEQTSFMNVVAWDQLAENIAAFISHVQEHRPSSVKGEFVKNVVVSSTMGPGVKILVERKEA